MKPNTISNVSDTALWIAAERAWESARPDALFRDPFAERLAGERGQEIARTIGRPAGMKNGWPSITRTKLLDDMVMTAVEAGCTCVLNLAAGLDTRPYRLSLPSSLQWVEADLPAIFDEKERLLIGEKPRCALERVRIDLADGRARAGLFARVDANASKVLVITEGLVIYLDEALVSELGRDLAAHRHFVFWALDFSSPAVLKTLQQGLGPQFANAPMKFAPANGVAFFEALGWRGREVQSLFHEGARLRRLPWWMRPLAWLPRPDPYAPGNKPWSGVVFFERKEK
jgi:methyltransferase (TIGR00027 family)